MRKRKMIWIVLGSVFGLVLLAGVVAYAMGAALPVEHTASVSKVVKASPEKVWELITDVEKMPTWRKELKSIQRTESKETLPRWIEKSSFGDIPFQTEVMEKPRKLVTRIDDTSQGFGGRWTFVLEPDGDGTKVTITEDGEVYSPLFRFMSKYIFGHSRTLQAYMEQLVKTLREGR